MSSAIAMEAFVGVFLLVAYGVANHFTGEGINYAVWYHVRYGLRGAGFHEYQSLIIVAAATVLVAILGIAGLVLWRRARPRSLSFLLLGQLLLISALLINPGARDLIALSRSHSPATADFFQHYRPASATPIAQEHPNLVFIFAESLERTYFDERRFPGLITHLRQLEQQGTSFTRIQTVEGTGFTMGGMVGSLCGIPLFTPAHGNSMSGMDVFLPGTSGLSDLLHDHGYFLSFIGGAELDFAGKGKFLRTHHFDESAGFSELHGRTRDRTYINNWGLYDDTTFDFAYERLTELARQKQPFGLFFLTLDTHPPMGYVSKSATAKPYGDGTNPMLNAVKASDELIARFVERVRTSPVGDNTVIVIVSDHLAMLNAASDRLRQGPRSNLFLILDPRAPRGRYVDRVGSTLDIGATVLRPLGFKGSINLGRDLLDPQTSESEILHIQKTETLLSWRPEIIRLWDFPRFTTTFSFEPKTALVKIDGRQFQAPVLIELGENGHTTLRFQFNALYESHLAEQAAKLPFGKKYLLVVKRDDAQNLLSGQSIPVDSPWVLIAGKAGAGRTAIPLSDEVSYSKLQIDQLLARSSAMPIGNPSSEHRVGKRNGTTE
jgi:phosphoglycerol transferase